MNILPKKRWHVRTKDNIARVRRDEAEASEKEEKQKQKLELAESEARINFLRKKSGLPEKATEEICQGTTAASTSKHVDFFSDFKSHIQTKNEEHEKEAKDEREKYEKQIGYLTYLGQNTNEALKLKSWYEVAPQRNKETFKNEEKDMITKSSEDPLTLINALLPKERKLSDVDFKESPDLDIRSKHISATKESVSSHKLSKYKKVNKSKKDKKKKKHKKEKQEKYKKEGKDSARKKIAGRKSLTTEQQQQKKEIMECLRKERLQREAAERARQNALLHPKENKNSSTETKSNQLPRIVQKYNSQFNPELAKQNIL